VWTGPNVPTQFNAVHTRQEPVEDHQGIRRGGVPSERRLRIGAARHLVAALLQHGFEHTPRCRAVFYEQDLHVSVPENALGHTISTIDAAESKPGRTEGPWSVVPGLWSAEKQRPATADQGPETRNQELRTGPRCQYRKSVSMSDRYQSVRV